MSANVYVFANVYVDVLVDVIGRSGLGATGKEMPGRGIMGRGICGMTPGQLCRSRDRSLCRPLVSAGGKYDKVNDEEGTATDEYVNDDVNVYVFADGYVTS